MLAWHVLLSGSKQGCESGGRLETLLSSPAVIHGGVGNTRFGGLEWREPHVLLSMVDQLRSGVLSLGSGRGLHVGWACCHLNQPTVSTIPARILLGVVWFGLKTAPEWMGSCHTSCHRAGQCVHPENRAGLFMLCPWCWQGRQQDCENGSVGSVACPGLVSTPLSCVVISDGETQVSSKI